MNKLESQEFDNGVPDDRLYSSQKVVLERSRAELK